MTDQQAQTPFPPAQARAALRQALLDGRTAIEEFVAHEPTLRAIDTVLASEDDIVRLRTEIREVCSFLSVEARTRSAETVAALKATLVAARQPLRCPDCGDEISVIRGYEGTGYLSHDVVTGFECDEFRCGAAWNTRGVPEPLDD